MPINASTLYYGVMGIAVAVFLIAAINYLRLATQIAEILNEHSAEWRYGKTPALSDRRSHMWPIRRLDTIILTDAYREMLPADPPVQLILRRARMTGWILLIAFVVAVMCLGAADAGSRYR